MHVHTRHICADLADVGLDPPPWKIQIFKIKQRSYQKWQWPHPPLSASSNILWEENSRSAHKSLVATCIELFYVLYIIIAYLPLFFTRFFALYSVFRSMNLTLLKKKEEVNRTVI